MNNDLNEKLADAIINLINTARIAAHPSNALVYMIDGILQTSSVENQKVIDTYCLLFL